jgi:hypothetical protein
MSLALPGKTLQAAPEYFQICPAEFTTQGFPDGSTAILTPAPLIASHAPFPSRITRWSAPIAQTWPLAPTEMSIALSGD